MKHIPLYSIFAALLFVSPLAHAQDVSDEPETGSGDVVAQSGSTTEHTVRRSIESIQQRAIQAQWEKRKERAQNFRKEMLQSKEIADALRLQQHKSIQKRTDHRAMCRSDIRRASKLTKLKTSARCYREELNIQLDQLEKEREYVELTPGISDDVRWLTLTRLDLLSDAIAVVINAIDSDVYETLPELEDVKQNLVENYRKPYWLMMTRVRADRLQTWTASLMTRISDVADTEGIDQNTSEALLDAIMCLTDQESLLQTTIKSQDNEDARSLLREAYGKMNDCTAILRDGYAFHTENEDIIAKRAEEQAKKEAAEAEALKKAALGADKPISRRLSRRLPTDFRINRDKQSTVEDQQRSEQVAEEESSEENEEEQVDDESTIDSTLSRRLRRRFTSGSTRINGKD